MFYGRYGYPPQVNSCKGNLRYQRVSEYNLQTFLNMKNNKLREEQIMSSQEEIIMKSLGVSRDADKNTIKRHIGDWQKIPPDANQGNAGGRALPRKQQKPTIY